MPSYRDIFPARWLRPDVIGPNRVRVMVERVTRESLFNPTTKKNEDKLIAKFRGKELRLILNKTSCLSLEKIFATDDFSGWHGKEIMLSTAKAPNGKDTIVINALSGQVNSPAPTTAATSAPQTEAQDDDLWEPDAPVDEDFYPDDHPAKTPDGSHGQEPSGARPGASTPIGARPVNSGISACLVCHAPPGKMHASACTAMQNSSSARLETPENVRVHGQEVTPEKVAARPATPARTFEQEVFDFDAEVYAQMATLYDSSLPISSELTEFMRKARNSDHDSAMKMSATYLKTITATLQGTLAISEDEAYMLLTALVGYRVDAAARPGQLIHGYILKPLRDDDEVVLKCLKELSDVCLTIYSEMMEGAAGE